MPSGDDLEDDYVPDASLVVVSEDEDDQDSEGGYEEFNGLGESPLNQAAEDDKSMSKKRKRREKEKEKKAKRRRLTAEQELAEPPSVASQVPTDIGSYLCTQQTKSFPNLSVLELEELKIPDSCIVDTTSYTEPRKLEFLGNFIAECLPKLKLRLSQKPRANGAPTLIFVAGAALRVADVTRMLKKYRGEKGGEVAKLFARHFKLQEHIAYLQRTKVGTAVGTPARLGQLLEKEAISLTALTHVMIDVTHRDAKKRSMLDIPETRDELFRGVLGDAQIRTAFQSGKLQLVLF